MTRMLARSALSRRSSHLGQCQYDPSAIRDQHLPLRPPLASDARGCLRLFGTQVLVGPGGQDGTPGTPRLACRLAFPYLRRSIPSHILWAKSDQFQIRF